MEKILENIVLEELGKLRYKEVLYEGEVYCLAEKACYEYNQLNVDLKELLNDVYNSIYNSK